MKTMMIAPSPGCSASAARRWSRAARPTPRGWTHANGGGAQGGGGG